MLDVIAGKTNPNAKNYACWTTSQTLRKLNPQQR